MDPVMLNTGEIRFHTFLENLWEILWNSWYRSCGANTELGLGVIPRVACGRQQIDRLSEVGRFLVLTMRQSNSVRSEL